MENIYKSIVFYYLFVKLISIKSMIETNIK